MSETDARLDEARARLMSANNQGEAMDHAESVAPKRTKNPSYVVLKQGIDDNWELLSENPVQAPTRKAAIVAATEGCEEKDGVYLVLAEKEYRPLTRSTRKLVVDTFG